MRKQFLIMVSSRIFSSAIQAVSFILLARWIGPDGFGAISVVLGISMVVFSLADFGLSSYIPRARAKGVNADVARGLDMGAMGYSIAGLGMVAVLISTSSGTPVSAWLFLLPLSQALDQYVELCLTISIADGSSLPAVASILTRRSTSFLVFILLFWSGAAPLAAYGFGLMFGAIVGLVLVRNDLRGRISRQNDKPGFSDMYRLMRPYLIANLSAQARTLDSAVIGAVTSLNIAGLYSIAYRLVNPLTLVSQAAVSVVLPHSSKKSLLEAKKLGEKIAILSLLVCLPLIPVIIFSEPIVVLIFGANYSGAGVAFSWAIVALPFMSISSPLGGILQGQGFQRYVATNGFAFAVISLAGVALGSMLGGASYASAAMAIAFFMKSSFLYLKLKFASTAG
ncbi:lipopolysaccharide biosynthesis protein [Arthrobacter psychrolactophilus]